MNNKLINILQTHLESADNHVVKITCNGVKLAKSTPTKKYAFTLDDIAQKYVSIANFLQVLPQKGFAENVEFTLQKTYTKEGKTSYHIVKEITENLTHTMSTTHSNVPQLTSQTNTFLGAPELMAKMVQAERSADYKEQVEELKETVKDLRSRNRVLEEKNSSLTLKLDTEKERSALRLEKELLNKKSFIETPAFEKTMEALGGMLPKIIEATTNNNAVAQPSGLGIPNVSPIKKAFMQKVSGATDEQAMFFNYLLDNWKEDLIQQVAQIVEQKEQQNEDSE